VVASFQTTRWSLVVAAGGDSSAARAALASLCELYWYPLYAYVRRHGYGPDDACDLTQAFFTSLLERRDFEQLTRARGRFRAFLLASLKHFLANDVARRRTLKRGSGVAPVSLSVDHAEERYAREPADVTTPETLYERRWALTVIERVLATLRDEWRRQQREQEFDALRSCLLGTAPPGGYAAMAATLSMSEGAVKTAVHRLRRRFRTQLRQNIAETVSEPGEIEEEVRYLIRALSL
jgi:DNA-directed RNA polymerase specialized sigma24 family protein